VLLDYFDYLRLLLTDYIELVPLPARKFIRESVYLVFIVGGTVLHQNGFLDGPRADFRREGCCVFFSNLEELLYIGLSLTPFASLCTY
jgi:hypothetical protein